MLLSLIAVCVLLNESGRMNFELGTLLTGLSFSPIHRILNLFNI